MTLKKTKKRKTKGKGVIRMKYKRRFQDIVMQSQYEDMIKKGVHWKTAEAKVLKIFKEYDGE